MINQAIHTQQNAPPCVNIQYSLESHDTTRHLVWLYILLMNNRLTVGLTHGTLVAVKHTGVASLVSARVDQTPLLAAVKQQVTGLAAVCGWRPLGETVLQGRWQRHGRRLHQLQLLNHVHI